MDRLNFLGLILNSVLPLFTSGSDRLTPQQIAERMPAALATELDEQAHSIADYDGTQNRAWVLERALAHWGLLADDGCVHKSEVVARIEDLADEPIWRWKA